MSQGVHPLRHLLALTVVLALVFAGAGFWVAKARGAFEPRLSFTLKTDSGEGLTQGMKVSHKGFRLGQLQAIELRANGEVHATVEVLARHAGFFTEGVTLRLSKEKIVTSELVLQPPGRAGAPLRDGAVIALEREDITADLAKRVEPILDSVNALLVQLADPKLGIQATLTQSRQTMAQTSEAMHQTAQLLAQIGDPKTGLPTVFSQTRDTMTALLPLAQQGQATLAELERSLAQTRSAVQQSQALIGQLGDGDKGLTAGLARLSTLLDQLNDPAQGIGATLGRTGRLIDTLDTTVKDVTQAPVYRFLVPKREPAKPAAAP
jgi:ABC-type transporter Mla subunit MlaD